jgi:hypothetical protein
MNSLFCRTAILLISCYLTLTSMASVAPIVHLTFDDGIPKEAVQRGDIQTAEGISGKGVLLGDDGASARSFCAASRATCSRNCRRRTRFR